MNPTKRSLFPALALALCLSVAVAREARAAGQENIDVLVINLNLDGEAEAPAVARLASELRRLSGGASVAVAHFEDVTEATLAQMAPRAVVLSPQGEPWWTWDKGELARMRALVRGLEVPVLGVCGGHQLLALAYGAQVAPIKGDSGATSYEGMFREKGRTLVRVKIADPLVAGMKVGRQIAVHEYHAEEVKALPEGFVLLIEGEVSRYQGIRHATRPVYGVQFHPESRRSPGPAGAAILSNFLKIALER